jgi:hypothetical protein
MAEFKGKIKGRLLIGDRTIPGAYLLSRMIGALIDQYQ